jgi:DNA-binding winged helix-turn-helix (wHTH) protein
MTPEVMPMLDRGEPPNPLRTTLATARYVRFGPLQVDQQRQEVTKNGARLKLQGKVYQVLLTLLEKPGEVVTREELRQRLWPADTHVNYDANVNTTVNKLRQALGDSSDKPVYIETVPRRGYCFVMQPEFSDHPAPANAAAPAPATVTHSNSNGVPQATNADASSSGIWITLGVIGLILAGMLLGAGITKLWILHSMPSSPFL